MINRYFDKIYCYSLFDAIERRESIERQAKEKGIVYSLVDAVDLRKKGDNDNGVAWCHIGINRTLVAIIDDAIKNNYKSIVVFQDDVILSDDFNQVIEENIKNVPDDWDFISLGCFNYFPPQKIIGRVHKTKAVVMDHAICINSKVFEDYKELLKKEIAESDMSICRMGIENKVNIYSIVPYIAKQGEFYSSYTGRVEKEKECD